MEGFVKIILKSHSQAVFKVKKKNIETGTKATRKQQLQEFFLLRTKKKYFSKS